MSAPIAIYIPWHIYIYMYIYMYIYIVLYVYICICIYTYIYIYMYIYICIYVYIYICIYLYMYIYTYTYIYIYIPFLFWFPINIFIWVWIIKHIHFFQILVFLYLKHMALEPTSGQDEKSRPSRDPWENPPLRYFSLWASEKFGRCFVVWTFVSLFYLRYSWDVKLG